MHTPPPSLSETAPASAPTGPYIWLISLVAALGGLLFGYDWVVIGGAKPFYERYFALTTPDQQGWAMSCALVGSLAGALVAGAATDRWGRKKMLLCSALLFGISSIATGLATSFTQFILWRIAGGMAIGLASSLSPLYIAEVAPAHLRGRLVSMNQFTIVVGILAAQITNWLIADKVDAGATPAAILASWNGQYGWRWMFGVTAIPSALFVVGCLVVPESPRWLASRGRLGEARTVLERIGNKTTADREIAALQQSSQTEVQQRFRLSDLLAPRVRKALGLGIVLAVFQQWCGINVVFNYAEEIFSAAGYGVSDILFNIVITGGVNLLFTVVALATVDRWGRRKLMLLGSAGLSVIYVALGACLHFHSQGLHVLLLVLLAIGCYAMSLAPVTWVIISEVFPNRIRGIAMSVAVSALWVACFLLTFTFPLLNRHLGPAGTFWTYAGICVLGFFFILGRLLETKGKSLEEIENE